MHIPTVGQFKYLGNECRRPAQFFCKVVCWTVRFCSYLKYPSRWSELNVFDFIDTLLRHRPRPEEVVWAIKTGRISEGVPYDLKRKILNLRIYSAPEFTAYEEGCPRHPSWPAMHAASTALSFWLAIVLDLNPEQLCQARLTDFAISYARTIAVSTMYIVSCKKRL